MFNFHLEYFGLERRVLYLHSLLFTVHVLLNGGVFPLVSLLVMAMYTAVKVLCVIYCA